MLTSKGIGIKIKGIAGPTCWFFHCFIHEVCEAYFIFPVRCWALSGNHKGQRGQLTQPFKPYYFSLHAHFMLFVHLKDFLKWCSLTVSFEDVKGCNDFLMPLSLGIFIFQGYTNKHAYNYILTLWVPIMWTYRLNKCRA